MQLDSSLDQVRRHLSASLALADEQTRAVADLVVDAAQPALRLALTEAVADALADATMSLAQAGVGAELRLVITGRDLAVLAEVAAVHVAPAAPADLDEDATARITLRLPDSVKRKADTAAQAAGQSLNSYIVAAIRQSIETTPHSPSTRHGRRQVSGWV